MLIQIISRRGSIARNAKPQLILRWDDWNDYSFYTLFGVIYVDPDNHQHNLGAIKIGFFGQNEREKNLKIGDTFENGLPADHFSIGVDDEYYVKVSELGSEIRDLILISLNDIAKNADLNDRVLNENVYKISFLRGLSQATIEGQFRRLTMGGAKLTPYKFKFTTPALQGVNSMTLDFNVEPLSNPPTNIHIVIGRNGVGKTFMINNMIDSLTKTDADNDQYGYFEWIKEDDNPSLFANLICVTFSAFDEFEHPPEQKDKSLEIHYAYIGLKAIQDDGTASETIDPALLKTEFLKSIFNCKKNTKLPRWQKIISMLDTDPIFRAANVAKELDFKSERELNSKAKTLFKKLSTGHKLVLLTITRLVEKLEERSLVLIDEPESHLHPPLLSSFMRALNELLIDRNAVSIIATHSPVVLQEVPQSCVYKLRRNGSEAIAERPRIETFGENVGVLTHEVFGLEVTDSGFHGILKKLAEKFETYNDAIEFMNNQIGLEAKGILRGLFYEKTSQNDSN